MSKNISITAGGQAKTFAGVQTLRTALVGGGSCDWVPSDEAGAYAGLTAVTFTENGVFTPPTGVDGYNSVTVNVANDAG